MVSISLHVWRAEDLAAGTHVGTDRGARRARLRRGRRLQRLHRPVRRRQRAPTRGRRGCRPRCARGTRSPTWCRRGTPARRTAPGSRSRRAPARTACTGRAGGCSAAGPRPTPRSTRPPSAARTTDGAGPRRGGSSPPTTAAGRPTRLRVTLLRPAESDAGRRGCSRRWCPAPRCADPATGQPAASPAPGGTGRGCEVAVPAYSQQPHRGEYPRVGQRRRVLVLADLDRDGARHLGLGPNPEEYAWSSPTTATASSTTRCASPSTTPNGAGNWSFNTAYAALYGTEAYVTRLRDLAEAEDYVVGIPLVASVAFEKDSCRPPATAPPVTSGARRLRRARRRDRQRPRVAHDPEQRRGAHGLPARGVREGLDALPRPGLRHPPAVRAAAGRPPGGRPVETTAPGWSSPFSRGGRCRDHVAYDAVHPIVCQPVAPSGTTSAMAAVCV